MEEALKIFLILRSQRVSMHTDKFRRSIFSNLHLEKKDKSLQHDKVVMPMKVTRKKEKKIPSYRLFPFLMCLSALLIHLEATDHLKRITPVKKVFSFSTSDRAA